MILWRRIGEVLLLSQLLCLEADGLNCFCTDCGEESICTVADGGACYAQLTVYQGIEIRRQRCYQPAYTYLCNYSSKAAVIECCHTDLCNEHLHPEFPDDPGSTMQTPPPTTDTPNNNTYIPPDIVTTTDPSEQEPPTEGPTPDPNMLLTLYCYEYDSDKNTPTTYCSSRIGCYRMERRDPNTKVVTRQKQGCSESCVEEERNRVTKICCNSTLCNGFQWQTPPPFLTTSPPETSGEGSGYMASEILQSISTSSKQPVASTSSRYPTSTAYQATTSTVEPLSLRTGSSTLLITLQTTTPSSMIHTLSSTTRILSSTTSTLSSTTRTLSSTMLLVGSDMVTSTPYLVASVLLSVMCAIVLAILIVLTIYMCRKNRQLLRAQQRRRKLVDTVSNSSNSTTV